MIFLLGFKLLPALWLWCHKPCSSFYVWVVPTIPLLPHLPSPIPSPLLWVLAVLWCWWLLLGQRRAAGAWQEGHYVGEYACSQLRGLKARVLITAEQSIINPALEYQIPVRLGHCLGILKSSETEIISFRMTRCQIKHFSYYPFFPLSLSRSLSWII